MQLFALDSKHRIISAKQAIKQIDYICLECNQVVRLRSGIQRQAHFYHLSQTHTCKMNGKSMEHLQVQCHIAALFPTGEIELECRFPEIGRIADACWKKQRIAFEIQCSGIKADEVKERNKDYAAVGYQVVWILHDQRFNKYRISAAEKELYTLPHYFTNIDEEGKGIIYDQYSTLSKGTREKLTETFPLALPELKGFIHEKNLFPLFSKRLESWPYYFSGDFLDRFLTDPSLQNLFNQNTEKTSIFSFFLNFYLKWIKRPYHLFFQIILERCCK